MAMIRLKVTNTGEYAQERAGHYLPPDSTTEVVVSDFEETQFSASERLTVEVLERGVDMSKPIVLAGASGAEGGVLASDSAKKLAAEHGIGLSGVEGTGQGGRITVNDVKREVEALGLELEGRHQDAPAGAVRARVVEPHVQTPDQSYDRLEVSRANTNVEVPDVGRHVLEQHNPAPPNTHREIPDLVFDSKEVMPVADMSYEERHEVDPGIRTEGNVSEGVAPPLGNFPERAEAIEETNLDPTGHADMHEDSGMTPFPRGAARGSTRAANQIAAKREIREKGVEGRAKALREREAETEERLAEEREALKQRDLVGAADKAPGFGEREQSGRMGLTQRSSEGDVQRSSTGPSSTDEAPPSEPEAGSRKQPEEDEGAKSE